MPERPLSNLEAAAKQYHTVISTSSRAMPTTGTRAIARRTKGRSRIVISTARMTGRKRPAPAPAWARRWAARQAFSPGSAWGIPALVRWWLPAGWCPRSPAPRRAALRVVSSARSPRPASARKMPISMPKVCAAAAPWSARACLTPTRHGCRRSWSRSAVNVRERAAAYRQAGWQSFNVKESPYTADQVRKERELYMRR